MVGGDGLLCTEKLGRKIYGLVMKRRGAHSPTGRASDDFEIQYRGLYSCTIHEFMKNEINADAGKCPPWTPSSPPPSHSQLDLDQYVRTP